MAPPIRIGHRHQPRLHLCPTISPTPCTKGVKSFITSATPNTLGVGICFWHCLHGRVKCLEMQTKRFFYYLIILVTFTALAIQMTESRSGRAGKILSLFFKANPTQDRWVTCICTSDGLLDFRGKGIRVEPVAGSTSLVSSGRGETQVDCLVSNAVSSHTISLIRGFLFLSSITAPMFS